MSDYFDSKKFVGETFDLVFKNLTETGKKYQKDISNNQVFQRFLIDFTIAIEQSIRLAVEKEEYALQFKRIEETMADVKKRLVALQPPGLPPNDPMVQ